MFKNIMAHGLGQFIAMSAQLILPAVLLGNAGAVEYGVYIAAQSAALIYSLLEFGLPQGMQNLLILEGASNRFDIVKATYDNICRRVLFLLLVLLISVFLVSNFGLGYFSWVLAADFFDMAVISCLITTLYTFSNLATAVMALRGMEANGVILANLYRLGELLALGCGVVLSGDLLIGLLAQASTRGLFAAYLVFGIFKEIKTKGKEIEVLNSQDDAFVAFLQRIRRRGLHIWTQTISSVVLPNGVALIVLPLVGPEGLAIYGTARTLARMPVQAASFVSSAISVQISRLYAINDAIGMRRLLRYSLFVVLGVVLPYAIFSMYFLDEIARYWLRGKISLPFSMYAGVVLGSAAAALSIYFSQMIVATGRAKAIASLSIYSVPITLVAAFLGSGFKGVDGLAYSVALIELGFVVVLLRIFRDKLV